MFQTEGTVGKTLEHCADGVAREQKVGERVNERGCKRETGEGFYYFILRLLYTVLGTGMSGLDLDENWAVIRDRNRGFDKIHGLEGG